MFLSKGANVNTQTDGGHSALQYAASRNRPEVTMHQINRIFLFSKN